MDDEGLILNRQKGTEAENLSLARQIKKQLANGPYKNIISTFRLVSKHKGQRMFRKDAAPAPEPQAIPKPSSILDSQR
eukprot:scaffold113858_cov34-Prasinocladus_malaysianus.AAC.1